VGHRGDRPRHDHDARPGLLLRRARPEEEPRSTIAQCFAIFAVVSLVWALWGYTLALGPPFNEFIGSLTDFGLNNVGTARTPGTPRRSGTPVLRVPAEVRRHHASADHRRLRGADPVQGPPDLHRPLDDVRLRAIAHWNWGVGGWLKSLGVIDFAGGLVVHTPRVSLRGGRLVIGRRQGIDASIADRTTSLRDPGASVLWFGCSASMPGAPSPRTPWP